MQHPGQVRRRTSFYELYTADEDLLVQQFRGSRFAKCRMGSCAQCVREQKCETCSGEGGQVPVGAAYMA